MDKMLARILDDEFLVMVIPVAVALPKDYILTDILATDTAIIDILERKYIVTLEVENTGTLVFSSRYDDGLFEKLQKKYRGYTNFVFGGNQTYGYFKELILGKIARKIASFGVLKGNVRSYEQLLGKPCDYELHHDCVYRLLNEQDRLERFKKEDVLAMLAYYIDLKSWESEQIKQVSVYHYMGK